MIHISPPVLQNNIKTALSEGQHERQCETETEMCMWNTDAPGATKSKMAISKIMPMVKGLGHCCWCYFKGFYKLSKYVKPEVALWFKEYG